MLIVSMIVCFALIFIAGMHWAVYDHFGERSSLIWCIAMSVLGIYNMIGLVGRVVLL